MFEIIKSKIAEVSEISKKLRGCTKCISSYYTRRIGEISDILTLQNQVAALSNSSVADALMQTVKQIAVESVESNYRVICTYLEEAIEDLMSGMDATEMLWKYDCILRRLKIGCQRGYRAKMLIYDDLCDINKEEE